MTKLQNKVGQYFSLNSTRLLKSSFSGLAGLLLGFSLMYIYEKPKAINNVPEANQIINIETQYLKNDPEYVKYLQGLFPYSIFGPKNYEKILRLLEQVLQIESVVKDPKIPTNLLMLEKMKQISGSLLQAVSDFKNMVRAKMINLPLQEKQGLNFSISIWDETVQRFEKAIRNRYIVCYTEYNKRT